MTMKTSSTPNSNLPTLSKRQRHAAGPNPSNTWQQQPRIKSAGARARAYIAQAGLADDDDDKEDTHHDQINGTGKGGNKRHEKKKKSSNASSLQHLLLDPQIDLNSPEVKFGRLLGGTDQRKRHEAVKMLRAYLTSRADFTKGGVGFSQLDFLKLWKGLWYTLYMADKTPVQDKLSKVLAELMWCLAGTEEEDEYAGKVFLEMEGDDEYVVDDDDDDGDEKDEVGRSLSLGIRSHVFEDDDGDTMEILDMKNHHYHDDDDDDDNNEDGNEDGDGDSEDSIYDNCDDNEDEDEDEDDENNTDNDDNETDDEEQHIKDMNEKHCRGAHLVCLFISTFLCTIRREWCNVDKHRVDKFYTAVRCMISETYKYWSKRDWNIGIINLFNDAIYDEGLSAETVGLTNGLRYHLIDICIDELAKINKEAKIPLTEATFLDCIEPFFVLAQRAVDKNVQKRVMRNVLLKFLNEYSFVSSVANNEMEHEDKALIFDQVHVGTVSNFIFQIASDEETDDRFRKSLYEMHKQFERQIKEAGRDVNDVELCIETSDGSDNADFDGEQSSVGVGVVKEDCDVRITSSKNQDAKQSATAPATDKKKEKEKRKKEGTLEQVPKSDERDIVMSETAPATDKKKQRKKRKKEGTLEQEPESDERDTILSETALAMEKKKHKKTKKKEVDQELCLQQCDEKEIEMNIGQKSSSEKKKGENIYRSVIDQSTTMKTPKIKREKDERSCNTVINGHQSESSREKEGSQTILSTKSKSLKNQKKECRLDHFQKDSNLITSHVETPAPNSKKKRKSSPPSVDPRSMHSVDQISSPGTDDAGSSPSRRVSFGSTNHSKSHKASMKAMKALSKERWDTRRTPEKSILRPSSSEKVKSKTKSTGMSSSRKKYRKV